MFNEVRPSHRKTRMTGVLSLFISNETRTVAASKKRLKVVEIMLMIPKRASEPKSILMTLLPGYYIEF